MAACAAPWPLKNGTGASGTWAINISGQAASAANAVTLNTDQTITGAKTFATVLRVNNTTGGGYCEGIRINGSDSTWVTIALGTTAAAGSNTYCWSIHRKNDNNFCISRNSSDGANGLVMTTVGMGLGTTAPNYRLHVAGLSYANQFVTGAYGSGNGGGTATNGAIYFRLI